MSRSASSLGVIVLMAVAGAVVAGDPTGPRRPMTTFSIVAHDPLSGELGVAVQSHWFGVGSSVPWAEAGVGAVATQSFVDPAYGPRGLDLMRRGLSAPEALAALLEVDNERAVRQVAMVDNEGVVTAHTGSRCIASAGQHVGSGYSVQANMMLGDEVVPAMAKAFEEAKGDLAERLLVALEAAQAAGGDIRGRQSAALLVVKGQGSGRPWLDRVVDLRVEDHAQPLVELRRLLVLHRAYAHMDRGDAALERADYPAALNEYGEAARLAPDNLEVLYWQAVTLATNDREDAATPIFRRVFAEDPHWVELTRRLPAAGMLPDTTEGQALVERILALAPKP